MVQLKFIILIFLCLLSSKIIVNSMKKPVCVGKSCDNLFENYLKTYKITVADNETKVKYKQQFLENLKKIQEFNAQPGHLYKKGINKFTHLPFNEVANKVLGLAAVPPFTVGNFTTLRTNILCNVTSFDWRDHGCVSPVKDQGNCGSCFAFAAIAAIESQILIKYNENVSLSEQFAMECIYDFWKIDGDACNGGLPGYVYYLSYIKRGFASEDLVPYLGFDRNNCPSNVPLDSRGKISSFKTFIGYDEDEIACMLAAKGPISIAMYVSDSLIRYSNGIYNDVRSCSRKSMPNHAVLLVGFGTDPDSNTDYFIAKNSWGNDWGEKGFFRIRRGINLCNIQFLPQQPFL